MSEFEDLVAAADHALQQLEWHVIDTTGVSLSNFDEADLAAKLCMVEGLRARLNLSSGRFIDALKKLMGNGETIVDKASGLAVSKKQGGQRKAWQHAKIRTRVAEALIQKHTNPETGTVETPLATLLVEAMQVPTQGQWKVGKLKELGVPVDALCEYKPGKVSISVGAPYGEQPEESPKDDDDDFV